MNDNNGVKIKIIFPQSVLISTKNTYQDFMKRRDKMIRQLHLQSQNPKREWWNRAPQQSFYKHLLLRVAKNFKYVRKLDMKEFEIQNVKSQRFSKVQAIAKKMNRVNSLALKSKVYMSHSIQIPSDFVNLWVRSLKKLEKFDFSLELDEDYISSARKRPLHQTTRSRILRIHPNLQDLKIAIPSSVIESCGFSFVFSEIPIRIKRLNIKDDLFQNQILKVLPRLKNLEIFSFEFQGTTDKQFVEDLFTQLSQLLKLSSLNLRFQTKAPQQLNTSLKLLTEKKLIDKISLNFGSRPYELEGLFQYLEGLDLTHFSLSVNIKSNHRLIQLSKFLGSLTKLQSLELAIEQDSHFRKDGNLKDFIETIFNLKSLKNLNLRLSTFSESSNAQHSIADFQPNLKTLFNRSLESLSFFCNQDDLELFPNLLKSIQETKPDLKILCLNTPSHYFEETRNQTLLDIIKELRNAHVLELGCIDISSRHILTETVQEINKMRYLRELSLGKIDDEVPFSAFVAGVQRLMMKRGLRHLIVNNIKLEEITSPRTNIYLRPEQRSSPIQRIKLSQIRKINPALQYYPSRSDLVIVEPQDQEWISF